MKKIQTIGISVFLACNLLTLSIVPVMSQQDGDNSSRVLDNLNTAPVEAQQDDLKICKESGEEFVSESLETTSPEWEGAELVNGTAYHDLQGNVISYVFGVAKDGKSIGYLVVGNSCYNYNVIEAAETTPPIIPNEDEAKGIIESSLEIKDYIINDPMPVYLGYNLFYAIYDYGEQRIGINLRSKDLTKYSELESCLTSPEDYKATYAKKQDDSTKDDPYDYVILGVIKRDMHDIPDTDDNCGPTTGAMITWWWETVYSLSNLPNWDDDHEELYDLMDCNDWFPWYEGVPPWMFGPGIEQCADDHGYDDFVEDWCVNRGYDKIQDEILDLRPMGVMFSYTSSYTCWHWCCVKGYDTRGETDYIVMNDPDGAYESTVDWDAVDTSSVISRIWRD